MTFIESAQQALRVIGTRMLTPLVKELTLAPLVEGARLPGFAPGAHIALEVNLPSGRDWRRYSLVNIELRVDAMMAPACYTVAVRREESGLGGSRFVHDALSEGDVIQVRLPRNEFELAPVGTDAVLLGGGIGITPLLTMAAHCRAVGRSVRLLYVGRQRAHMAYLRELEAMLQDDLTVHCDDERGGPIDLTGFMACCAPSATLHVCGPQGLLDGVLAGSRTLGWPASRVRFELFGTPAAQEDDRPFEVVLNNSGQVLSVPVGKSILDVLEEAGCDPMSDCRRGECGVCVCPVLEGEIDHRDYVLTDREKAAGNTIVACVSRARSGRITLDM